MNKDVKNGSGRRKGFGERCGYAAAKAVLWIAGVLPLRVTHALSATVGWLLGDVVRYRRRVVMGNLRSAFPEIDEKHLKDITRK